MLRHCTPVPLCPFLFALALLVPAIGADAPAGPADAATPPAVMTTETNRPAPPDTADTTIIPPDSATPRTATARTVSADTLAVPASRDTSYRFWRHPYWLIGASWTLGSSPLFSVWEQGMADSLGAFGLTSDMFPHDTTGGKKDYRRLMFEVKEKPNTYNVSFPVRLAWVPVTDSTHSVAICLEGDFMIKTFQATIRHDTSGNRVNIKKSLMQGVMDVGVLYELSLPSRYFSITDIDRASLLLGLFIEPLLYLRRSGSAKAVSPTDSIYSIILNRTQTRITESGSAYGFGISWRIGITTIKQYSEASGLVAGLSYRGGWQYYPTLHRSDINPSDPATEKHVSSLTHKLSLDVQFAAGRKKPLTPPISPGGGLEEKKPDDKPPSPPPTRH